MIIAVASGFAAPAISSGWHSREVRQGTRKLAGVMRGLRERAVRRGVEQELVLDGDGQTFHWSEGQEATLPEGVAITGVRGGWRDPGRQRRASLLPERRLERRRRSSSARREGDGLQFAIEVEPLLGSVVIRGRD